MKFTKIKKIFIYFLLTYFLILSVGLKSYAGCRYLKSSFHHEIVQKNCDCCNHSSEISAKSEASKCNCCLNAPISSSKQYISSSESFNIESKLYYFANSNFVNFKHLDKRLYNKVSPMKNILFDKTLAMLNTVILLN